MRNRCVGLVSYGVAAALALSLSACAAKAPGRSKPAPDYDETPVPTVPPGTPTPEPTAAPLPTRPIGQNVKPRKGEAVGPVVTFLGAARADGSPAQPESVDKNGVPTYLSAVGSGFMLVIEAKPGANGFGPGRNVFSYVPGDPSKRPDLLVESDRDLGDGNPAVCDRRRPNLGGIPGIKPANFAETQRISDALNDFACRFETFIESESSCTLAANGEYSFRNKDSTTQFCMIVARAWAFPVGETTLTVRLRDTEGNLGPPAQLRIRRPPEPKPAAKQQKKPQKPASK